MFLPLPIETVRSAWEEWRASNDNEGEEVRLLETKGGCVLVTNTGRPPKVFIDLLKSFLSRRTSTLARAS
jgi:hypothetical protein